MGASRWDRTDWWSQWESPPTASYQNICNQAQWTLTNFRSLKKQWSQETLSSQETTVIHFHKWWCHFCTKLPLKCTKLSTITAHLFPQPLGVMVSVQLRWLINEQQSLSSDRWKISGCKAVHVNTSEAGSPLEQKGQGEVKGFEHYFRNAKDSHPCSQQRTNIWCLWVSF